MQVSKLWRYPTKSRGGEPLETAQLTADGITGDRIVNVRGARSPLTGQTRQSLLTVPARLNGQLHHIAIGRTHTGTRVTMLIADLDVRIIHAATGEILRRLTLDPTRRYHGTGQPPGPPPRNRDDPNPDAGSGCPGCLETSQRGTGGIPLGGPAGRELPGRRVAGRPAGSDRGSNASRIRLHSSCGTRRNASTWRRRTKRKSR